MDIMQFLAGGGGGDATGLLTPQQQTDINSNTLQTIGAGLMKAGGPSPYKANMTALSGIGEALQGGLAARRQSQQDALTQTLVKTNTMDKMLPILKLYQDYQISGVPPPPQLVNMMNIIGGLSGSGIPRAPGGAPGAPGAPGGPGASGAAPGMATAPAPGVQTADAAGGAGAVGTPGIVSPQDDLINKTARELGINPLRVRMGDPSAIKAIEERIHANDPTLAAAERRKLSDAADVAHSEKAYPAFAALGQIGDAAKRDAELSQALMSSPGFYSGLGNEWELFKKQFANYLDPSDATSAPMTVFRKITAANINNQIEQAAVIKGEIGAAGGRTFQSQIDLYKKASQSLDNSEPSNRFLADLQIRFANQNIKISDMAVDYKIKHGILDAGFDKELSTYLRQNPLYTEQEYRNLGKVMKGEKGVDEPGRPLGTLAGSSGAGMPATAGFSGTAMPGAGNMLPNQGLGSTTAVPGTPSADFLSPQAGQSPLPGAPPTGVNPAPLPGRPAQQPTQAAPVVPQVIQRPGPNNTTIYQTKINGVWVPSNRAGVPLGG